MKKPTKRRRIDTMISRQRVQQILEPSRFVNIRIEKMAQGCCQRCGIPQNSHGHLHHKHLGKAAGAKRRQGTRPKNIRRAMQRMKRREARFRRDVNHCISKELVTHAKDSGRGVALEELTHIRTRTRFRKRQRATMSGWAFSQLRQFVTYKAKLAGVLLVVVDPRYTSQTCAQCGHCEKANRVSQAEFLCKHCGFSCHADVNGALNIRARARASVSELMESEPRPPIQAA